MGALLRAAVHNPSAPSWPATHAPAFLPGLWAQPFLSRLGALLGVALRLQLPQNVNIYSNQCQTANTISQPRLGLPAQRVACVTHAAGGRGGCTPTGAARAARIDAASSPCRSLHLVCTAFTDDTGCLARPCPLSGRAALVGRVGPVAGLCRSARPARQVSPANRGQRALGAAASLRAPPHLRARCTRHKCQEGLG